METPLKLEKSGYTAFLKDGITYGEHQILQGLLMKNATGKMNPVTKEVNTEFDPSASQEWTMRKLLIVITRVSDKDGNVIPVNKGFLDGLPLDDGLALEEAVDSILDGNKKKET